MLLRCPAKDPFHNLKPARFTCHRCGTEYVVPSDELSCKHHRCARCRARLVDVALQTKPSYHAVIGYSASLGVAGKAVIATEEIVSDDHFRELCREPRGRNYGSSIHCPPHSPLPSDFRQLLRSYRFALVFCFDVPSETFSQPERREIGRLLHETTADLERLARQQGFERAAGYAAGGCRQIFCHEHDDCAALQDGSACRFPDIARTSMSGLGVNTRQLMEAAGWRAPSRAEGETPRGGQADAVSDGAKLMGIVLLE